MTPFEAFMNCGTVSTDTRNIVPGSVFFALKGARFNGNEFAEEALKQGASFAVIDESAYALPVGTIIVEDVLQSLQECARLYRKHLGIPVVGLTGSNGKTTNKELFHAVLSKKYKVHATPGNLNNHIGVPLTLLSMKEGTELAVIEMGANHQGEISELSNICLPNVAYITNFGKAHLEGFGGVEGIIRGKSELYRFIEHNGGRILLNLDDPIQMTQCSNCHDLYTFGNTQGNLQWRPKQRSEFAAISFEWEGKNWDIQSQLTGDFNQTNIAAAVAMGTSCEVPVEDIITAIQEYKPSMNRIEWRNTGRNKVLLDAYNANPTSMALSIQNFAQWHPEGWMILGDMFELGEASAMEHQNMVDLVVHSGMVKRTLLVGKHFAGTEWSGHKFDTAIDLANYWKEKGAPKDASVLLKGSRGIALEQLLPLL
jgi:UDP-N-acetylmuramoyl-tripeptide--D-alanyl-D-alanine ligase